MATKQMGFFMDSSLCTGCKTCMIACKDKWDLKHGVNWRRVFEYTGGFWHENNNRYRGTVFSYYLSISCNHCEKPVCVEACPTTAMHKREQDGIVEVDHDKCIGCRYCEWACPYGAPQYDEDLGQMTKCNLCRDYLEKGLDPACVASCPNRALNFGTIEELREKFGKINELAPLPASGLTDPCLVIKPHRDAQPIDRSTGEIANPEEV